MSVFFRPFFAHLLATSSCRVRWSFIGLMEVTREDAGRAGPSTAKAASPTGRERQPREAGPPIIDAADAASRGDLTAEVVETKLAPGPIGSTINEEVPQFTRAARILSLGSVTGHNELLSFLSPASAPPKPAGRLTEAPPSTGRIGRIVPAERAPSEASSLSDELYMDPGPPFAADECPHAPRIPRRAPQETERTTAEGPSNWMAGVDLVREVDDSCKWAV